MTLTKQQSTKGADLDTVEVALAASGDASAFERLYHRHVARVHSLARRMLDNDLADEVTQDVFVRAWQKLHTFRGEAAFGTWLHRLAINVILARRGSLGRQRQRFTDSEIPLETMATRTVEPGVGLDLENRYREAASPVRRI